MLKEFVANEKKNFLSVLCDFLYWLQDINGIFKVFKIPIMDMHLKINQCTRNYYSRNFKKQHLNTNVRNNMESFLIWK